MVGATSPRCSSSRVLDVIYQIIEQRFVHVDDAIMVAIILAIIPYLIVRGPVNRLARRDRKIVKETTDWRLTPM